LSVLENYSDRECSILLDCTTERVVRARVRALQRLGDVRSHKDGAKTALTQSAA
jgi:hypothetical protein